MAQKTNNQLLKEIWAKLEEVQDMQTTQAADINSLKLWRQNTEIAKAAVEEYKRSEAKEREERDKRNLRKQFGYVLGLGGLALYIWLSAHGVHLL